jgi:hypothetical protein
LWLAATRTCLSGVRRTKCFLTTVLSVCLQFFTFRSPLLSTSLKGV